MLIGFYSGLLMGFMRFVLSVLFINLTMFRVDKTGLPKWVHDTINLDWVNYAYNSLLLSHHTHNNPVTSAWVGVIMDHIIERRQKKKSLRKKFEKKFKYIKKNIICKSHMDNEIEASKYSVAMDIGYESNMRPVVYDKCLLVGNSNQLKDKRRFLKVAYRWQLCVLLLRNKGLMKFRKVHVAKGEDQIRVNFFD
jgi:hypothetical protein